MSTPTGSTVYLKYYTVPDFFIPEIELDISLFEEDAVVRTNLVVERNNAAAKPTAPLQLDVDELILEAVVLDGIMVTPDRYILDGRHLTILTVPDSFELATVSRIYPQKNTKLMGIYTSSTGFFSLCEAEGFRRITPFLDRPDVMAKYTVTLHANREHYPVLLANGNLIAQGEEGEGRHWATWRDPFPKPSYLFAVVAARLDHRADTFLTRSGKEVLLQFFVEPGKLEQSIFALESLKKAMKWDEDTYGLELDLDQYSLVAVGDFNAGAMENKGLNIFNTKLVLARPDISTDFDFSFIDRTVAHEYFHNWTGDRVTCRDWFQLSLKEGLTVFRKSNTPAICIPGPWSAFRRCASYAPPSFPRTADLWLMQSGRSPTSRSATSTPTRFTPRGPRWCA
jgi:aminopeptidase N